MKKELLNQANRLSDNLFIKNKDKILIKSIEKIFQGILEYVFISGSFAYGGSKKGKSDIDFGVVFNSKASELDKNEIISKIKRFIKIYEIINLKNSLVPDHLFSGEYMTIDQVNDAILGRGFSIIKNKLVMPFASDNYYLKNYERWFQAWLTMSAFSIFVAGNINTFLNKKIAAWRTVILFILSNGWLDEFFNSKSLIHLLIKTSNKGEGLGINNSYKKFEQYEKDFVKYILEILKNDNFLISKEDSYIANRNMIQKWKLSVINSSKNNILKKAPFLFSFKEVLSFNIHS